jgi:hypothetical protein
MTITLRINQGNQGGALQISNPNLSRQVAANSQITVYATDFGITGGSGQYRIYNVNNINGLTITPYDTYLTIYASLQSGTLYQQTINVQITDLVTQASVGGTITISVTGSSGDDQQQVDAIANWASTWDNIRGDNPSSYYNQSAVYQVTGDFYPVNGIPSQGMVGGIPVYNIYGVSLSYNLININPSYSNFYVTMYSANRGTVTLPTVPTTATLQISITKVGAQTRTVTYSVTSASNSVLQTASDRLRFNDGSSYVNIGGNNYNSTTTEYLPNGTYQTVYQVTSNLNLPVEMSSSANNYNYDVNVSWAANIVSGTYGTINNIIDTGTSSGSRGQIYPQSTDVLIRLTATLTQKNNYTGGSLTKDFYLLVKAGNTFLQNAANRLRFNDGSGYVNIGGNNNNATTSQYLPDGSYQTAYQVTSDLSLPVEMSSSTSVSNDINVSWAASVVSSNSYISGGSIIDTGSNSSTRGRINPQTTDTVVRLTATLTQKNNYSGGSVTKEFYLVVKASNNQESVRLTREWLTWSVIRHRNSYENAVFSNLSLPLYNETHGTTISWSSDRTANISNIGAVTPPTSGTVSVRLTATITKGTGYNAASESKQFNLVVTIPASDQDRANAAAAAAAFWETIRGANTNQNEVTADLVMPSEGAYDSTLTWSSNRTNTISNNGVVNAPTTAGSAADVTITATARVGYATASASITVKVVPITNDADAVRAARNSLTWDTIKNRNTEQTAVDTDLTLVTSGKYSTTISWSSSRPEVIAANGRVVPTIEAYVTLTATISRGTARETKSFNIQVKPASVNGITETADRMTASRTQADFAADTYNGTREYKIDATLLDITFDAKAAGTIYSQTNGNVVVTARVVPVSEVPSSVRTQIGDRKVYDLAVVGGDRAIGNFNGGTAVVRVPYSLQIGEKANSLVGYYLDSFNTLHLVRGYYDAAAREIVFRTKHFSRFAIGYNPKSYIDIEGNWAKDSIEFIGARELTIGVYGVNFNPSNPLSRGEFTANLMKAYGIEIDPAATANFTDVNAQLEYAPYLATGKKMGLITGTGDNNFEPERQIGRAEMFALLYNVLKAIGEQPPSVIGGKSLSSFTDANEVGQWFREGVEALLQAGMIDGTGNNLLQPRALAARATMAQMIHNLLTR